METSSQLPNSASPPPITVAVVEDDVSIREVLVNWLRKAEGFAFVGEFPDAESAVAQLVAAKPNIVLMDINLPRQSGIECVRTLKPLLPETQFVMVTVYEDATHIFHALAAGATGYLLKHTPREALIKALVDVHSGGSPMTSNVARKVAQAFQQAGPKSVDQLSTRENEVLALLAQGYLYKEIGDTMGVKLTTVNSYIRRIYEKLHVQSRSQAVAIYVDLPNRRE